MRFTPHEARALAITFPKEYAQQIHAKAKKYRTSPEDTSQETSLIIIEKIKDFDQTKGTLCQFIFGHLEKRMRRQLGAHTFAVSLDHHDILDDDTRSLIENLSAPSGDDEIPRQLLSDLPGAAKILSIASFASGKSSSDIARLLRVTPRRARQILQQLREDQITSSQFELCLEEVC